MRATAIAALMLIAFAASTGNAFADTWVLLVQPAPYSQSPPPYSSWQSYQQFGDLESCLDSRMALHYDLWKSDQDLSMRALAGVCRNEASGEIVTDWEDEDL